MIPVGTLCLIKSDPDVQPQAHGLQCTIVAHADVAPVMTGMAFPRCDCFVEIPSWPHHPIYLREGFPGWPFRYSALIPLNGPDVEHELGELALREVTA